VIGKGGAFAKNRVSIYLPDHGQAVYNHWMGRFTAFLKGAGTYGGGSVVLAILLFAVAIGEHVKDKNIGVGWLEWIAIVFFCFGAYKAWDNTDKRLQESTRQLKAHLPNVIVEILSAYILPRPNSADCFVQARLHNVVPNTRARIIGYEFCLIIAGNIYCTREPSDVAEYGIGRIEWDEEDNRPPSCYVAEATPLKCLQRNLARPGIEPLIDGVPEDGWLRFEISSLPDWPHQESVVGHENVWDDDESEWVPQEITETEYFPSTVTAVKLSVEDSFHAWTEDMKTSPLGSPDFGITSLRNQQKTNEIK